MSARKIKTLQSLKDALKKTLPQQISKVIRSYEDFSEQPVPYDAKGFGAHHNACKSAVVHAETLLKLARWTEDEIKLPPVEGTDVFLEHLLDEAETERENFKDEE